MTDTFTYRGYTIRLQHMGAGTSSPVWVAEVQDDDRIFVTAGFHDDDPERIRHLVRDWIRDGMLSGGINA